LVFALFAGFVVNLQVSVFRFQNRRHAFPLETVPKAEAWPLCAAPLLPIFKP
jgi:hypothetical protein